jgi:hypothetical protein
MKSMVTTEITELLSRSIKQAYGACSNETTIQFSWTEPIVMSEMVVLTFSEIEDSIE